VPRPCGFVRPKSMVRPFVPSPSRSRIYPTSALKCRTRAGPSFAPVTTSLRRIWRCSSRPPPVRGGVTVSSSSATPVFKQLVSHPKVLDRRSGLADHGATAFTDANDRGARQVQAPNRDAVIRPGADRPKSARLRRLGFVYLSLKHAGQPISHLLKPLRFVAVEMTA
jgi:hypothetical protein